MERGSTKKQITVTRKKENKRGVILLPQGSNIYNWFWKENKEIRVISYKSMEIVSKGAGVGKVYNSDTLYLFYKMGIRECLKTGFFSVSLINNCLF